MAAKNASFSDYLGYLATRALLGLFMAIPYGWRVPLAGWFGARVVGPVAGWNRRVAENLALVCPELSADEVRQIQREVAENTIRTQVEIYSGEEFKRRVEDTPLTGPGVAPFRDARAAGRPVVLVTAHMGNYDAVRAALFAQGYPLAALYRPMHNKFFNDFYVGKISAIGEPVYPTDRGGVLGYVKYLAAGGAIGILTDVHSQKGTLLTFFGKPARTATSASEWAVQNDALVVPVYGLRQPDGMSFEIYFDAPVPNGDPEEMTQTLNDGLEALVRRHMGQWFWVHRRWK